MPEQLSDGDSQILSQIFDPEGSLSPRAVIDDTLPADLHVKDKTMLSQLRARESEAICRIEQSSGPEGDLNETTKHNSFIQASELFSRLIQEYPKYASAYNNRAQATRWRYGDDELVRRYNNNQSTSVHDSLENILEDLDNAIKLTTPASPSGPVSPFQAKLLAQAHTQRATLLYTASKHSHDCDETSSKRMLQDYNLAALEDVSARDFYMGGRYGNEISKAMAVHTNPYAKMCGNIVKEAMRNELSPSVRPEIL
jgi:hypothetical protein